MRTRPVIGCTLSDQCFVGVSVRASPIDQMLKYGSLTASGTAGARCFWAKQSKVGKAAHANNSFTPGRIDRPTCLSHRKYLKCLRVAPTKIFVATGQPTESIRIITGFCAILRFVESGRYRFSPRAPRRHWLSFHLRHRQGSKTIACLKMNALDTICAAGAQWYTLCLMPFRKIVSGVNACFVLAY